MALGCGRPTWIDDPSFDIAHELNEVRWVGTNVADRARPPVVRRPSLKPPSPEDVIRLIEAAKQSRRPELGVFFHVAAVTRARRG